MKIKGMDKDMKCQGFQFEKSLTHTRSVRLLTLVQQCTRLQIRNLT